MIDFTFQIPTLDEVETVLFYYKIEFLLYFDVDIESFHTITKLITVPSASASGLTVFLTDGIVPLSKSTTTNGILVNLELNFQLRA